MAFIEQRGDAGHGFSQPHIVRQYAAQTRLVRQIADAALATVRPLLTEGPTEVEFGQALDFEIRRLVHRCKKAVHERFGVVLREEIVYLGFD